MSLVKLNTFKDIIDLTLNRIDELEDTIDPQIEVIVKNAINQAYINDLSDIEKNPKVVVIESANGIVTLPSDLSVIESVSPPLAYGERRIGNVIFTNNLSATKYTICYTPLNKYMTLDDDVPNASDRAKYLLSTYACAEYFSYRKKPNIVAVFREQYDRNLGRMLQENDSTGEEYVKDVRGVYSGE